MPFDNPINNPTIFVSTPVTNLLEDAWRLIDRPQKWCRGQPESIDGRRLCSITALQVTSLRRDLDLMADDYVAALSTLSLAMGGSIMGFNDTRTHAELTDAWQRAIAISRQFG